MRQRARKSSVSKPAVPIHPVKITKQAVQKAQAIGEVVGEEIAETLPPVKTPKFMAGFVEFVRTQGVVGLAVGLVLGTAAKSVVDGIVNNVFNPIVGALGAGGDLAGRFVYIKHNAQGACINKLGWGAVLSTLLSFVIVAGLVYFVVMGLKLDKLDKKKE